MNEGWEKAKRAREILGVCGIEVGADFQALGTSQVVALAAYADQHRLNKYGPRKPPTSIGSLLRSFHDLLQRRAKVRITSNRETV
jgi:hypothetical protein